MCKLIVVYINLETVLSVYHRTQKLFISCNLIILIVTGPKYLWVSLVYLVYK